jgi:hypothetical protein
VDSMAYVQRVQGAVQGCFRVDCVQLRWCMYQRQAMPMCSLMRCERESPCTPHATDRYMNDYCRRILDERRTQPLASLQGRPDYVSRLLCSKKVGDQQPVVPLTTTTS